MGRHAPARHRRRARPGPALLGVAAATVIAVGAGVWVVTRPGVDPAADAAPTGCTSTESVRVAAAPDLAALVDGLLPDPVPYGDAGACADAVVRLQEPLETVGDLQSLPVDQQPQVWVPDDESWVVRAGGGTQEAGPLARTSVVLATSRTQAEQRGWTTQPPTWAAALSAGLETPDGLALGDPDRQVSALEALAAVPTTLGEGAEADALVTAAAIATRRGSGDLPAALATAVSGGAAPVVVATEFQVAVAVAGGVGELVVVRPVEGTPSLQAPVVATPAAEGSAAAAAVLAALVDAGEDGRAVRAAGWRSDDGTAPTTTDDGTGVAAAESPRLDLEPALVQGLLGQLGALTDPSRLLAVVDVSLSMEADAGDGSRADLASAALGSALTVLPDATIGALWIFAAGLAEDQDWTELVPPRSFDTQVDGRTQRELLLEQIGRLPELLDDGGTGLYDTTLAAVRSARDGYDPGAVNTVVLVTDGSNEDGDGISEADLLATLAAETDPARPVQLIAVGIGPDADQAALERIAAATGGAAYAAVDPAGLTSVLFDALRNR